LAQSLAVAATRAHEKGHGNSIRRLAMTSILKRDSFWGDLARPKGT
jgi:hypothetical protein